MARTAGGEPRLRVIYFCAGPQGLLFGRQALDPLTQRALEQRYPDVTFDWPALLQEIEQRRLPPQVEPQARRMRPAPKAERRPPASESPADKPSGAKRKRRRGGNGQPGSSPSGAGSAVVGVAPRGSATYNRMMSVRLSRLGMRAAAVLLGAVTLTAQQPPAAPPAAPPQEPAQPAAQVPAPAKDPSKPDFATVTSLVSTDVIPRDGAGLFLADLKKEEFLVVEDGVEQTVASLTLVHGGRYFNLAAPPPAPVEEGMVLPPPRPVNDAAGRIFLLFVDDLHLDFRNTPRIRDLFKKISTELIHDGDMFGIVSTGPSSISVDLTYDRRGSTSRSRRSAAARSSRRTSSRRAPAGSRGTRNSGIARTSRSAPRST